MDKVSRSEKSLSALTKRFLEMLKSEKVLDLNIVSEKFEKFRNHIKMKLPERRLKHWRSTRSGGFTISQMSWR